MFWFILSNMPFISKNINNYEKQQILHIVFLIRTFTTWSPNKTFSLSIKALSWYHATYFIQFKHSKVWKWFYFCWKLTIRFKSSALRLVCPKDHLATKYLPPLLLHDLPQLSLLLPLQFLVYYHMNLAVGKALEVLERPSLDHPHLPGHSVKKINVLVILFLMSTLPN